MSRNKAFNVRKGCNMINPTKLKAACPLCQHNAWKGFSLEVLAPLGTLGHGVSRRLEVGDTVHSAEYKGLITRKVKTYACGNCGYVASFAPWLAK